MQFHYFNRKYTFLTFQAREFFNFHCEDIFNFALLFHCSTQLASYWFSYQKCGRYELCGCDSMTNVTTSFSPHFMLISVVRYVKLSRNSDIELWLHEEMWKGGLFWLFHCLSPFPIPNRKYWPVVSQKWNSKQKKLQFPTLTFLLWCSAIKTIVKGFFSSFVKRRKSLD